MRRTMSPKIIHRKCYFPIDVFYRICDTRLSKRGKQMTKIVINYVAVDGFASRKQFSALKGARKYAQTRVGKNPEMGLGYAVSSDGIGRIVVSGCKLADLFGNEPRTPNLSDDEIIADAEAEQDRMEQSQWEAAQPKSPSPRFGKCTCSDDQLRLVGCDCEIDHRDDPYVVTFSCAPNPRGLAPLPIIERTEQRRWPKS